MLLQACTLPPLRLVRSFRSGQVDRYQVESSWNGPEKATYQYELFLTAEKYRKQAPVETIVSIRAMNLLMTRNDEKLPVVKMAGAFGVKLGASGGPNGLSVAGPAAIISLPMLCWYLPATTGGGSSFAIEEVPMVEAVHVSGMGKWTNLRAGKAQVTLEYGVGSPKVAFADQPVKVRARVDFVLATGKILSAKGTVTDPQGTMNFSIVGR